MAILIDPPAWPAHGTLWSHLVSDTGYDELHAFATRLGIPRRSFDLDHYDVPASLHERAVALGALPVTAKDVVHGLRDSGLRVRQADRLAVAPLRRREYLNAEWVGLGRALSLAEAGPEGEAWRELGTSLLTRWNEAHRSYHDEQHLEDVLLALDLFATRGERIMPVTLLAAWFHDAVYKGTVSNSGESDELDSARLAVEALGRFDLPSGLVAQVGELIVATAPAHQVRDPEPPLAQLLDADLAIFAAPAHRYAEYATSVRAEYTHVTAADFAAGRARILQGYLERPSIYHTETARRLWEQRARENVSAEVERLTL